MSTRSSQSSSKRGRNPGQIGIGLVASVLTLGLAVGAAQGMARKPRPLNQALQSTFEQVNVKPVVQALSGYAALAQDGRLFPKRDSWVDDLASHGLLPGNCLGASPWKADASWFSLLSTPKAFRQANTVALPRGLTGANQLAEGQRATVPGTMLGGGHVPARTTFDAQTYGALLYDVDRTGHVAVLYGIGRLGNEAVVASVHTFGQATTAGVQSMRHPLRLVKQSFNVTRREPNKDVVSWHIELKNKTGHDLSGFVTMIFAGSGQDDNLKVSGERVDIPAGGTRGLDGEVSLAPGQGDHLSHISCEYQGQPI